MARGPKFASGSIWSNPASRDQYGNVDEDFMADSMSKLPARLGGGSVEEGVKKEDEAVPADLKDDHVKEVRYEGETERQVSTNPTLITQATTEDVAVVHDVPLLYKSRGQLNRTITNTRSARS